MDLKFHLREHMDEVWDIALTKALQVKPETPIRAHHVVTRNSSRAGGLIEEK